jgi:hypothetical protein
MAARTPAPEFRPPSTLSLDPERIVYTISQLEHRIDERFPESGLGRLCSSLLDVGEQTKARLDLIERPIWWLRLATWLIAALVLVGAVAAIRAVLLEMSAGFGSTFDAVQLLEAGIQDVIFIGFLLVFLVTAENRLRRMRALGHIRELRAIAHIVDMHQLTKDPDRLVHPLADTDSSPKRTLTPDQLGRYLDYCSELLSLTSKLAALYAERFSDSVILQAVDEVEALTTGLSNKIWQKIMVLDAAD